MKSRFALMALTTATVPFSFFVSVYPQELILQHLPTLVGLMLLTGVQVHFGMTWVSYACLITFLCLHIIGATWIYSFVPYDDVAEAFFGHSLSDIFGWHRNHYDRLVHLASGILGVPPASECLQRTCGMRPLGAAVMAIATVLAIGAIYEVAEWQLAVNLSPTQSEAYNGQQGDIWDPQKDLALAWLGSVLSAIAIRRWDAVPIGQSNPIGQ